MADGGEIAALFATLGLKVNAGQWAQGDAAVQGAKRSLAELDGAFVDAQGRWRAASGRFLTMGEKMAAGLGGVAPAAKQAGAAAESAGHQAAAGFDAAGAALKGYLLYLGGHFGYEHLIKFNQEMQDATISLAAMIEGQLGGSFAQATGHAKELYAEWQKFSTQTPVTTAEIVEFGKNIAAATFNAGGKLDDLRQITEQGVIAAKVLAGNRNAGYAALEISEMLSGNVSNRMMFVKQLLGMVKMTEDQFRALDNKGRLDVVKKALGSDAFKDAAQAFGQSFSGVTSTLKDKLQIAGGKIGMPLFERLTETVARFNKWLDDHGPDIERYGKIISDVLGSAFDFLGKVIAVVIDYGGRVLGWIGQFVDSSKLLKAMLAAIGIVLAVFAVQSAIAFATNPITLIVVALTGLIYLLEKLINYPGGIEQAFSDAFDAVSDAAADLWAAIKRGFEIAFDAVADLPVVKQLISILDQLTSFGMVDKTDKPQTQQEALQQNQDYLQSIMPGGSWLDVIPGVGDIARARRLFSGAPDIAPTLPVSGEGDARGPVALSVSVGDVVIHSPNADPVAVGDQVRKVFHEELGNTIRKATDAYG